MTFYADCYSIIYSPKFLRELDNIINYIAFKLYEPNTAKQFYKMVKLKTNSLHYFPERCVKMNYKNHVFRKLHIDN